jgi:hypothetical protein
MTLSKGIGEAVAYTPVLAISKHETSFTLTTKEELSKTDVLTSGTMKIEVS